MLLCVEVNKLSHLNLKGEDLRMQDIMKLAHQFLQNFCAGNQQNQALLHKHINLFLNPGVSNPARHCGKSVNFIRILIIGELWSSLISFYASDFRSHNHAAHLHEQLPAVQ